MKKIIYCVPLLSVFIISCKQNTSNSQNSDAKSTETAANTAETSKDATEVIDKVLPQYDSFVGRGYNSLMSVKTEGACIGNVKAKITPKMVSTVEVRDDQTEQSIFSNFQFGIPAFSFGLESVGVPLTLSGGLNFAKSMSFDSMSRNTIISVKYEVGSRDIDFASKDVPYYVINPKYEELSASQFANICGDSVLTSQTAKANLFIGVKYSFANEKSKNEFNSFIKLKVPVPGLSTGSNGVQFDSAGFGLDLNNLSAEAKSNIFVTINAYQMGGVPVKLSNILASGGTCVLSNLNACKEIFSGIFNYAAKEFPTQFNEEDVQNLSKNIESSKYYFENTNIISYNQLPIRNKEKFVGQEIVNKLESNIDIKNKIRNTISDEINDYLLVSYLRSSNPYKAKLLSQAETKMIDEAFRNSDSNFRKIKSIIDKCYDNIDACLKNVNDMYSQTSMYKRVNANVRNIQVEGELVTKKLKTDKNSSFNFLATPTDLAKYDRIYIKVSAPNSETIYNVDKKLMSANDAVITLNCSNDSRPGYHLPMMINEKSYIKINPASFDWSEGKNKKAFNASKPVCGLSSSLFANVNEPLNVEIWGINTYGGMK